MSYRVHVRVMPRAGLLDPQGQAVEHALRALGFAEAGGVRVGRAIELEVAAPSRAEAEARVAADVRQAARQSGDRGLPAARWRRPDAQRGGGAVPRQQLRLRRVARRRARSAPNAYFVWHRDTSLQGADVVILPGGFSYGDYLRSGAIARFSPIMQAVQRHAADGGAGARHLQRLPDPVRGAPAARRAACGTRASPSSRSRWTSSSSGPRPSFTSAYAPGTRLRLPVAHGDGRFVAADDTLRMLEAEGRVVLRYVPATRGVAAPAQPERLGQPHRRHLATPRAPWSASCPTPSASPSPARRSPDGLGFFTSLAAWQPRGSIAQRAEPMTTDKPSRNEDEYFAKQDAELLRQAARRRPRPPRGGRAEDALHEVPEGRLRPREQRVPRGADRDLPALRRHVARRRRARTRWRTRTGPALLTRVHLGRARAACRSVRDWDQQ